ncbi:MAG: Tat pathway signal protein [Sphingomonas bacterium]|nr:Tat pathway signal protein [Sphingomonas bacterium]
MNRRQLFVGGGAVVLGGAGIAGASLLQMGSNDDYDAAVASTRAELSRNPSIPDLLRFATLAANGHNTQPWKFRVTDRAIDILADIARRTPVVDPDDHHLFASLGCAAENLAIAGAARGWAGEISYDAGNSDAVRFTFDRSRVVTSSAMFDAIPRRQSTRAMFDGRSASAADLSSLAAAAAIPGVDLVLVTDRKQIGRVSDLVATGNSEQMNDPAFMHELKQWLRFNPRQALGAGDGLYSVASGKPKLPAWFGSIMVDRFMSAKSENAKYVAQLQSSAGVAIFVSQRADKDHWVRAGRACQRFALQATALGLKHAFVNQPVEVAHLRPELAALVGMKGRRPDLVMRFGFGPTLPFSARRPPTIVA